MACGLVVLRSGSGPRVGKVQHSMGVRCRGLRVVTILEWIVMVAMEAVVVVSKKTTKRSLCPSNCVGARCMLAQHSGEVKALLYSGHVLILKEKENRPVSVASGSIHASLSVRGLNLPTRGSGLFVCMNSRHTIRYC